MTNARPAATSPPVSHGGLSLTVHHMIRYSSIDKDCIVLAHARYRGVKCIWWDKPRTGQAIMLHLRDFDSVQLEVWKAEDNPRLLLEQYRSSGWKNPTEVLSEMREGTDARKD